MQSISKRPFVQLSSFRLISAAVVCATLSTSAAHAQEAAAPPPTETVAPASSEAPPVAALAGPVGVHFAQAGQWFLEGLTFWTPAGSFGGNTSDLSLTWSSAAGSSTTFNLNIQPVVGYFFSDVLFGRLGFDIMFNNNVGVDGGTADAFGIGIEPGVGIALPVLPKVTFAPWIGLNLLYTYLSASGGSENLTLLNLEVHAPLVFELVDHFGLTAGIYYAQGLVNHVSVSGGASADGAKNGTIGLTTGLLGYW